MRRFTNAILAAAAALGTAGVAYAGVPPITVDHPELNNREFFGPDTIVTIDIPAGLDGAGLTDGANISVEMNLIDENGDVVFGPVTPSVVGGPIAYDTVGGNTIQVDLGSVNFGTLLNNATITGASFLVEAGAGGGVETVFDDDDETVDETAEKDIVRPFLVNAFLNSDGDKLFLVFSESMNTGDPDNDDNHTVLADISLTDLQFDTNSSFDGTEGNPLGISNPDFVGADATTICFDVAGGSDIALGVFVRPAFDNMGAATHDFFDIVHNQATNAAVQVTALGDLDVEEVCAILTIDAGDGATPDVIRVTFNNPLDSVGDAAFFNALMLDGDASDLVVTAVNADPDDSSSVLLTVSAPGDDSIGPDALDNDTLGSFTIELDEMTGTSPEDIFGNTFVGTDSFSVADCITPTLSGDFSDPAFVDCDGDGTQDAVKLVFSEPLDPDSIDVDGIELFANDGVTVHPVALINLLTGEREEVTTDVGMDNELDIISIEIASTDANGDGDIDDRETNNTLLIKYDPFAFDWDGEDGDLDGDAAGTTDDFGLVNVVVTAADTVFTDAAGNAMTADIDADTDIDCAAPVLLAVNYFSGDNVLGGNQTACEQDGTPGDDDDNNIAQLVFTEGIDAGDIDEEEFRFGTGPNDLFTDGDFDGTFGDDDNVLQFTDNDGAGFMPGDTLRIRPDNGLTDFAGNDFVDDPAGTVAVDRTSPFLPLQRDINGNVIASAFLVDTNADGFANRIDLFFNTAIDPDTVDDSDFSVQGVNQNDIDVSVNGATISIALPSQQIAISSTVNVTYEGADDDTPLADAEGNAVAMVDCTFTARQVPTPATVGHFPAVMEITGNITGAPAGTKIFGMIAAPKAIAIRATMNNVTFFLTDSTSLEAMTNVILGLRNTIYLYDFDGEMVLFNDKFDDGQASITALTVTVRGTNVTFTGRGATTPNNGNSAPVATSVTGGTVVVGWDVLRSDDGSAAELYSDGVDDIPIVSSAVVGDDSGNYRLHMTAPIGAFTGNNLLNSIGAPVIIVVELPTGERFAVTSLLNRVGGTGPLLFSPTNRSQQNSGAAPADNVFNINLANVGVECLYRGWNLLKFGRISGHATASNQLPVLPRGVASTNVSTQSLGNATTLSQFVYYRDFDEDGVWTVDDDDDGPLDGIVIDVNCFSYFAFTLTSRGVQVSSRFNGVVSNGINNFVGGYAAGFFNDSFTKIGVFQFGAPITAGSIFSTSTGATSFPNNNVTLGWALVSYVPSGDSDTPVEFFTANPRSDFLIEFNRRDHDEVDITTARRLTASTVEGDNTEVECQALFVHYTN